MASPLLEVNDLRVDFATEEGTVHAVDGVSLLARRAARSLGIVGESGSGKSVTAMTIVGLTRGHERADRRVGALQGKELTHRLQRGAAGASAATGSRWSSRTR